MASKEKSNRDKPKSSIVGIPLFVGIAILLIGGMVYGYIYLAGTAAQKPIDLTPEAKAYIGNLKLSGVEMKAADSYLGQRITEIAGTITNAGPLGIVSVAVICVFYDSLGQVVLRERVTIIGPKTGGLRPGEAKSFRMPFDGISENWNKEMPALVIASIQFS